MSLLSIILAALGLGFLVLIHELGHLWVAQRRGMKVETFSIGFGRPLAQWKWGDVQWQVGWLPFGGYVRIAGMEVGKAAKQGIDLYGIQGGFFSKSPWARIQVALAGPMANLLLALVLFTGVWALGGRMRPYGEVTHRIGWVDPQSELFRAGFKAGDYLDKCDTRPFLPSRDWLCATIAGDAPVTLSGYHVDEWSGRWQPLAAQVTPYWKDPASKSAFRTMGVESPAGFLVYSGDTDSQTMVKGDRLLWMDGVLLYSARELSVMLNDNRVLVTIERNGQRLLRRVPRVRVADLWLTPDQRNQLSDWRYAASLTPKFGDLWAMPYAIDGDGLVMDRYETIDEEEGQRLLVAPATAAEAFLEPGDRIVAVNGTPISGGAQLLSELQQRRVHLIVQRGPAVDLSLQEAEERFFPPQLIQELPQLSRSIGSDQQVASGGDLHLVGPIEPLTLGQVIAASPQSPLALDWANRTRNLLKIEDPARRAAQIEALRQMEQRYMLGISLGDITVRTNPPPHELLGQALRETVDVLWGALHGGIPAKGFSGPIGIVEVLHWGWLSGIQEGLYWLGIISVNLALLNLLPIPVLDGGTVCLALWEWITRRRIKPRTMEQMVVPFVVLLIVFFLFVTYNDLSRLLTS